MAKRGQRYPYRVRYEWTSGIKGTVVASSLAEAELKADQLQANGIRHPEHDLTITILRVTKPGNPGTVIGTIDTATLTAQE